MARKILPFKFYFSWRITLIGVVLIAGMLRLSYWQWTRHLEKLAFIDVLRARLKEPPVPISNHLTPTTNWLSLTYQRLNVEGEFDFSHEMILRNRRHEGIAGVFLITPLTLSPSGQHVLVNRGFIPLKEADAEARKKYQKDSHFRSITLVKEPLPQRAFILAPHDAEAGPGHPWVDIWMRVDIASMQKQLPYPVLPIYLERMDSEDTSKAEEAIVRSSTEKEELLSLGARKEIIPVDLAGYNFPIATLDTVAPPARHLGYVFEWAVMALVTFLICFGLQIRKPRVKRNNVST